MVKLVTIHGGHINGGGAVGLLDEYTEVQKIARTVTNYLKKNYYSNVKLIVDNKSKNQTQNINYLMKEIKNSNANLNVSIHLNSFTGVATGTEVLVQTNANASISQTAKVTSLDIAKSLKIVNRGVKRRSNLGVLNAAPNTTILIECFFLNSKLDVKSYKENYNLMCSVIAQNIAEHLKYKKRKQGVHIVEPDDTLWGISQDNNMTVSQLKKLNPQIKGNLIKVGSTLKLR